MTQGETLFLFLVFYLLSINESLRALSLLLHDDCFCVEAKVLLSLSEGNCVKSLAVFHAFSKAITRRL